MSNAENLFICLLAICISSLEKSLVRSFFNFLIGLFAFLVLCVWAACIFWKLILCQLFHVLLFSPILRVVFSPLVSFAEQKLLSLIRSHLFTFVFISVTLGGGSRGSCFDLCHRVFCLFSSKSFIVSGLTFRSLIHFDFIFVCGVRKCSNFTLLHVAVQFSQHHLLKSLFPIAYSCLLCHVNWP